MNTVFLNNGNLWAVPRNRIT